MNEEQYKKAYPKQWEADQKRIIRHKVREVIKEDKTMRSHQAWQAGDLKYFKGKGTATNPTGMSLLTRKLL